MSSKLEIFSTALRLGVTSFGGPVAHIGYFRSEYVERRKWLDESQFADLVALCQFLPGPASSQTGFAIGLLRGGLAGGLLAFLGFTLPSMVLMIAFAYGLDAVDASAGWVRGMKIAAVAVVAHAVIQMARTLCPDRVRLTMAFVAAAVMLQGSGAWWQVGLIAAGAVAGTIGLRQGQDDAVAHPRAPLGIPHYAAFVIFAGLLIALPFLARSGDPTLESVDRFYRSGALVFGGGHVVLPLLEAEFVDPGVVSRETFLAGYGAVQAVPGPLFTFASFLGSATNGIAGGLLATAAIFLPSLLLVYGALPLWSRLRGAPRAQAALRGTNAVVVGLLLAALYDPVWTAAITDASAFSLGLGCYLLLAVWRAPAWVVVVVSAACGLALGSVPT